MKAENLLQRQLKHYWNPNAKSADCWQNVRFLFFCGSKCSGGSGGDGVMAACRLMVCMSPLPSVAHCLYRDCFQLLFCLSTSQKMHNLAAHGPRQVRGQWESHKSWRGANPQEKRIPCRANKLTGSGWLRGTVSNADFFFRFFLN